MREGLVVAQRLLGDLRERAALAREHLSGDVLRHEPCLQLVDRRALERRCLRPLPDAAAVRSGDDPQQPPEVELALLVHLQDALDHTHRYVQHVGDDSPQVVGDLVEAALGVRVGERASRAFHARGLHRRPADHQEGAHRPVSAVAVVRASAHGLEVVPVLRLEHATGEGVDLRDDGDGPVGVEQRVVASLLEDQDKAPSVPHVALLALLRHRAQHVHEQRFDDGASAAAYRVRVHHVEPPGRLGTHLAKLRVERRLIEASPDPGVRVLIALQRVALDLDIAREQADGLLEDLLLVPLGVDLGCDHRRRSVAADAPPWLLRILDLRERRPLHPATLLVLAACADGVVVVPGVGHEVGGLRHLEDALHYPLGRPALVCLDRLVEQALGVVDLSVGRLELIPRAVLGRLEAQLGSLVGVIVVPQRADGLG